MPSREEFMRQMGISTSDLVHPGPEYDAKPASRTTAKYAEEPQRTHADLSQTRPLGGVNRDGNSEKSGFQSKLTGAATGHVQENPKTTSSASQQRSKEEFLRSLGIDNYHEPTTLPTRSGAAATRNATGSQEYPKPEPPVRQPPCSGSFARARNAPKDGDDDDAFRGAYTPTLLRDSRDESFTLGRKTLAHTVRPTTAAELQSLGLREGATSEEVKSLGNQFFQSGDYRKAVRLYTRAIELDGTNAALYSNRSAAYLLGGKQMGIDTRSMALRDAEKTIKLKSSWFKGFSRRGDALFKLERYEEAYEAYQQALDLDPGNAGIQHSLNELKPHVKTHQSAESGAWAAPGSEVLHSSVASQSAIPKTERSAYELLHEFEIERNRTTPHLGAGGSEYKHRELERFRARSSTEENSSPLDASMRSEPESIPRRGGSSKNIPSEFSSDAAREYQASLLESYRKKKEAATRRK